MLINMPILLCILSFVTGYCYGLHYYIAGHVMLLALLVMSVLYFTLWFEDERS